MLIKKGKNANSTRHASSVFKLLKIVEKLVCEVESGLSNMPDKESQKERWHYIFGDKENIISVLVKLTGILVKIIPMENEIMSIISKSEEKKIKDLSEEDMEIIKRYLKKIQEGEDSVHKNHTETGADFSVQE